LVAFLILFFAMYLIIITLLVWGLLAAPLTKRREAQHVLPIGQSLE
jgi:NhaP-type Na+/H+ or K+/H+ antiporter